MLSTSLVNNLSEHAEGRAASSMPVFDVDNSLDSTSVNDATLSQSPSVTVETTKLYKT